MFLLQRADNPSYSTASAWQCKCGRFSLPLYRKQERSLFTAAMSADCLAASHSGPVDFPYPGATRRSRSQPVFRQVCHGTRDQTAARCCPPFHASIHPRRRPIVQWPMAIALTWSRSSSCFATFRACHRPLSIDRSHAAIGPGIGDQSDRSRIVGGGTKGEGRSSASPRSPLSLPISRPAGDPTPITPAPAEVTYSGEIESLD